MVFGQSRRKDHSNPTTHSMLLNACVSSTGHTLYYVRDAIAHHSRLEPGTLNLADCSPINGSIRVVGAP